MKSQDKRVGKVGAALGLLTALAFVPQNAAAGHYHSEVDFPYTHASGQTHRIYIPFYGLPSDGVKIRDVAWDWGGRINHQSYNVKLCSLLNNVCRDISYQKTGSSTLFNRIDAGVPFYFLVTSIGRPFVPEWGLKGSLTVNW